MTKRQNYSPDFKAKVALEAIHEDMTMAELSKKYGVHTTQIGSRKRAAIQNMVAAFSKRGGDLDLPRFISGYLSHLRSQSFECERDFTA